MKFQSKGMHNALSADLCNVPVVGYCMLRPLRALSLSHLSAAAWTTKQQWISIEIEYRLFERKER